MARESSSNTQRAHMGTSDGRHIAQRAYWICGRCWLRGQESGNRSGIAGTISSSHKPYRYRLNRSDSPSPLLSPQLDKQGGAILHGGDNRSTENISRFYPSIIPPPGRTSPRLLYTGKRGEIASEVICGITGRRGFPAPTLFDDVVGDVVLDCEVDCITQRQ